MRIIEAFGGPLDGAMVEIENYQPGRFLRLDRDLISQAAAGRPVDAEEMPAAVASGLAVYRLKAGSKKSLPRLEFSGWA